MDCSRSMFNELGYSQVTIRMIAMKLNMSSGNLNYHYKKRDDIPEALYFEMVTVFDNRIEQLDREAISLPKMKADIHTSMKRMVDYRFFWTDLYNLLQLNETIRSHFNDAYTKRLTGFHFVFNTLIEKKILKEPEFDGEHQLLRERMIGFSNTWLYASTLYKENRIDQSFIETQSNNLILMLYPNLTDLGKGQLRKLISG